MQDSWLQISCITPLMSSWHIPPPAFFSAQANGIVQDCFFLVFFFFFLPFFTARLVAATAENQRQPHTLVSVFHFVLLQKLKRKALEGLSSAQVRKQLFTMKKAHKFVLPELGNSCRRHHYDFFRRFLWPARRLALTLWHTRLEDDTRVGMGD